MTRAQRTELTEELFFSKLKCFFNQHFSFVNFCEICENKLAHPKSPTILQKHLCLYLRKTHLAISLQPLPVFFFNYSRKKNLKECPPSRPSKVSDCGPAPLPGAHSAPVPGGCWRRGAPASRALGSSGRSLPAVAMRRGDSRK